MTTPAVSLKATVGSKSLMISNEIPPGPVVLGVKIRFAILTSACISMMLTGLSLPQIEVKSMLVWQSEMEGRAVNTHADIKLHCIAWLLSAAAASDTTQRRDGRDYWTSLSGERTGRGGLAPKQMRSA